LLFAISCNEVILDYSPGVIAKLLLTLEFEVLLRLILEKLIK